MTDSSYYRLRIHRVKCPICMFSPNLRENIDKKILRCNSVDTIITYIFDNHKLFNEYDREAFVFIVRDHKEYLNVILPDVKTKSMYKSISHMLDHLNINELNASTLHVDRKVRLIYKIEEALMNERDNMSDEQLSITKALMNETLPLLITRFNKEIIGGKAHSIRLLSNSLSMTLDSITDLNKKSKENELKNMDEMELLEIDSSRKDKIVSLSDRIQQAVGKGD